MIPFHNPSTGYIVHNALSVEDNLSFSTNSCSFFKLLFQFSRKLCFQGAFSFYGERFAVRSDDTVWLGHCIHFSQCQSHSSCLHVFLKVFTLPSYIHRSHFPISCWKVAMVGLGNSVLCGKQGTWSWEGCFALPLLTPDPHSPEPGGAN